MKRFCGFFQDLGGFILEIEFHPLRVVSIFLHNRGARPKLHHHSRTCSVLQQWLYLNYDATTFALLYVNNGNLSGCFECTAKEGFQFFGNNLLFRFWSASEMLEHLDQHEARMFAPMNNEIEIQTVYNVFNRLQYCLVTFTF